MRQVLALITRRYTNRAIAERTSEIHVSSILGKPGVTSRTQAMTLDALMWPAQWVEYERHLARVGTAFSEAAVEYQYLGSPSLPVVQAKNRTSRFCATASICRGRDQLHTK